MGPFVPLLLAVVFLRGSSPFFFVAGAVAGLAISGYGYFRGRDYELVIEPKRIRWDGSRAEPIAGIWPSSALHALAFATKPARS